MRRLKNAVYRRAYKLALSLIYFFKLESIFFSINEKGNVIIMYHGIDEEGKTDFNYRFCAISDFKKQVQYFKKHFDVVPLSDFYFDDGKSRKGKRKLAITFDDGYKNNYKYAFPVLEQEKVHATFFVTSILDKGYKTLWADAVDIYTFYLNQFFWNELAFIKDPIRKRLYNAKNNIYLNPYVKSLPFDEKMEVIRSMSQKSGIDIEGSSKFNGYRELMNERDIREISQSKYISIGSHSCLHNNLGEIDLQSAVEELKHSKDYLEGITNIKLTSLAYPDGSYTRELIGKAFEMGFTQQFATGNYLFEQDNADNRIMKRLGVYSDINCIEQIHQVNMYV